MARLPLLLSCLLTGAAALPAQFLIAGDSSRVLYTVDPATGVRLRFGLASFPMGVLSGLAYDRATRTVYAVSTTTDSLFRLDLDTGTATATLIGSFGLPVATMHGLEWDSTNRVLCGVSSHDNSLYRIDTATGAASLVGLTGLTSFTNLGYDSINDVMYATNSGADSFYVLDRTTAAATLIGPLVNSTNPNGLAFDSDAGVLYMVDNSTDQLYVIDTTTGTANPVGSTGSGNLLGLLYLPAAEGGLARAAHACGATTLDVIGLPRLGRTFRVEAGNVTGTPVTGIGLVPLSLPFCTCVLGHEWLLAVPTGQLQFTVPNGNFAIGARLGFQAADVGASGGCAAPQLTLTDTLFVTFG